MTGADWIEHFAPSNPRAVITRPGWLYQIRIEDGLTETNLPWYALTRKHAEKRARRQLARYRRTVDRWTIT